MNKNSFTLFLLLFFLLMSSSCGLETSSSSTTCNLTSTLCSCDLTGTSSNKCIDYEGKSLSTAQSDCKTDGGTLSTTALCSTTGRVGTCKSTVLTVKTYTRYYSDAVTNEAACTVSAMGFGFTGTIEWTSN